VTTTTGRFTTDQLRQLVARASTLAERLGGDFLPAGPGDPDRVAVRLGHWQQLVGRSDPAAFARRLAWDGLDLAQVRRALGPVRLADDRPLPAWAGLLDEIAGAALTLAATELEATALGEYATPQRSPIPFEELLRPFLRVARSRVEAAAGPAVGRLAAGAWTALETRLLAQLASLSADTLHWEFAVFRATQQSGLDALFAAAQATAGRDLYERFVVDVLSDGYGALFTTYPVLARLMVTATDGWIGMVTEFLLRLDADWADLATTFAGGADPGPVAALAAGISDSHHHGRTVIALTFASGLQVVYKPKALGLEQAFFQLLGWLGERGAALPFRQLRVINRASYGWVEFAEHQPCPDEAAVRRYFRRAGSLMALLHGLAATDFHQENIVASGEHPVLVDLETLMVPRLELLGEPDSGPSASLLASRQLTQSVLATGLLPGWIVGPDGRSYDFGGLGWPSEQGPRGPVLTWRQVNTDAMDLALDAAPAAPRPAHNLVQCQDQAVRADDYVADLVDGFVDLYRLLQHQRSALLAPDGPLMQLGRERIRIVFRPTHVYAKLLHSTLDRKLLADGIERSIELDVLSHSFLTRAEPSRCWPVRAVEQRALEQLDIPHLVTPADSADLVLEPGRRIADAFPTSPLAFAVARLESLSPDDCERQVAYIRGALFARAAPRRAQPLATDQEVPDTERAPLSAAELVEAALAIGRELRQQAIRAADGSVTWIGLGYLPQAERFQMQPAGFDLYNGAVGIGLFLAALDRVTDSSDYRDLVLGALQPLLTDLRERGPHLARVVGLGSASGLGGIVYGLSRIGTLLDEPGLVERARDAAALIGPEVVAEDRMLDVLGGGAGTILGLLALHESSGEVDPLERAAMCARHLVEQRVASPAGYRTWQTPTGEMLSGFSHGAAGTAYALLRYGARANDPAAHAAAVEAIAYERSLYSPEARNWRDLRAGVAPDGHAFMTSWCNGAAGIALARIGGLGALDEPDVREDIEIGLATTRAVAPQGTDTMCCGTLGRADILLTAARRLDRADLAGAALARATVVVHRARRDGRYLLMPRLPPGVYSPGFFQGTAGIGYTLLRLAHPDRLPAVLLSE
jgi:type 2 lantibiotic biosynthesis protein LanM